MFAPVGLHRLSVGGQAGVVHGFGQPSGPGHHAFSRGRRRNDKGLQTRIFQFPSVGNTEQLVDGRPDHGEPSQQQDVALGGRVATVHHLPEESRPLIIREAGQAVGRHHLRPAAFCARTWVCARRLGSLQVCKFRVRLHAGQLGQVPDRSQRVLPSPVFQRPVVKAVRLRRPVFVGQPAQPVKIAPALLAATVGHGKSQRHILLVGGCDVRSRFFHSVYQPLQ